MTANDQQLPKISILEKCEEKHETLERKSCPKEWHKRSRRVLAQFVHVTNETVLNIFKKEK